MLVHDSDQFLAYYLVQTLHPPPFTMTTSYIQPTISRIKENSPNHLKINSPKHPLDNSMELSSGCLGEFILRWLGEFSLILDIVGCMYDVVIVKGGGCKVCTR